mmetsp:Transcript_8847/g.17281  ORF Transcript_8847/g.17281 Transcript_8847/m.17281 type:complete len:81 (+) Transcript_8847:564-806(+)
MLGETLFADPDVEESESESDPISPPQETVDKAIAEAGRYAEKTRNAAAGALADLARHVTHRLEVKHPSALGAPPNCFPSR